MKKYVAMIPAAGYASRMGFFKPLLPVSPKLLVIEKSIQAFREAGVEDIRVILGHNAHLLKPLMEKMGVTAVMNERYSQGMYTSVEAGVSTLSDDIEAFFFLPADIPFVSSEVIRQIRIAYEQSPCEVVVPVFNGERGHPPLISTSLRASILGGEVEGGLKALLKKAVRKERLLSVDDGGVLTDMDTESAYRKAVIPPLADYPTLDECRRMWDQFHVDENVIRHMQQVERVAGVMAVYLNSRGSHLHMGLIKAACLLHDVAKGAKDHAAKSAELVAARGYPEVAEAIAAHMDLPEQFVGQISEVSLVYLADKVTVGSQATEPQDRMADQLLQFQHDEEAQMSIKKRLGHAVDLQKQIEKRLGCELVQLLRSEIESMGPP